MRRDVEDVFLGLGYEIVDDREVETTRYNFDALGFPDWHPARSPRDTFFLDEDTFLRTETSPAQIHMMEEKRPPIYMVSIGRVYRRDTIDATHFPIFHQFEGLAIDRGITLADLKGTLLHVMRALFGAEREVRFRTHYFPFTEPSMEPDVSCFICGGAAARSASTPAGSRWAARGWSTRRCYEYVGCDPEEWTGFAFGLGLERTAQLRYDISDIRAVLGERPPLPEAVPMRVPLSWLASTCASTRVAQEIADALSISTAEVERRAPGRRARRPRAVPRRPRARGREASRTPTGSSSPRSTWGRTGRTRSSAAPGTSAPARRSRSRCPARRCRTGSTLERRELRGQVSEGMILAEDEVELGTDHTGIMVLADALEPGTPLADVLPLVEEVLDIEPTGNRADLLSVYGVAREVAALFGGELRRCRAPIRRRTATRRSTSGSTIPRAARATSGGSSATSRSASRRSG